MGITVHISHSNHMCAINAYDLPPCSTLRMLLSLALYCPYNNFMYSHKGCPFPPPWLAVSSVLCTLGLPTILLTSSLISLIVHHASPSSQTMGDRYNLAISVITVLSAVDRNTSTISTLIIIFQLNHFPFVSALLLPVLRLSLTLGVSIVKDNAVIVLTSTALPAHQAVRMFLLHRCDAVNETIQPTFQQQQVFVGAIG